MPHETKRPPNGGLHVTLDRLGPHSAAGSAAGSAAASAFIAASFSRSARMSASRLTATSRILFIIAPVPAGVQPAAEEIFLEPAGRVGLAVDRGLGEYACRLLERRRRDERARLQRGLGDAEQYRMRGRRLFAFGHDPGIDLVELGLVDLLALDQVGLAGILDLDLLQHLPHDHFDVLVVDRDALEPVDVLDLVDEVAGKLLDAFDRQDVVRRRVAFDDIVALLDEIAVLQMDVLALRDQILPGLLILAGRLDGDAPLVLVVAAESHRAGNLGDHRRFLRPPRLEQLRHPRQTAGDVARLGAFRRDTGDDVGRLYLGARVNRDDRVDRQHVAGVAAA